MSEEPGFTHAELLFALEIRQFAHKIRSEQAPNYLYGQGQQDELVKWLNKNPLEPYVEIALKEAASTAETIRKLRRR